MYVNFNQQGVTASNLDAFYTALAKFAASKGSKAASSWLFNLNPLANDHLTGEMNFTGGGYTRSKARSAVRFEYDHAPLPVACGEPGCKGVAWYKGTFGAHKCTTCGTLALDAPHCYLDDLDDMLAERGCQGHPAGPYDPMGVTVYCDGTCR